MHAVHAHDSLAFFQSFSIKFILHQKPKSHAKHPPYPLNLSPHSHLQLHSHRPNLLPTTHVHKNAFVLHYADPTCMLILSSHPGATAGSSLLRRISCKLPLKCPLETSFLERCRLRQMTVFTKSSVESVKQKPMALESSSLRSCISTTQPFNGFR